MECELTFKLCLVLFLFFSPRGFLSSVASRKDGAMSRAEIGEVTLCQVSDDIDSASSHALMASECPSPTRR